MTNSFEVREATARAAKAQATLYALWDSRIAGKEVGRVLAVGRFTRRMLQEDKGLGYTASNGVRVVYGDLYPSGNMEGSLYCFFEASEPLRVRWGGSHEMSLGDIGYLNGYGSALVLRSNTSEAVESIDKIIEAVEIAIAAIEELVQQRV